MCPLTNDLTHGKFIVIEGGDSSGKHTQAQLLFKHFKSKQIEVEFLSFPQYDSPFGELVAKYLRGEYGTMSELPPEIPCLLYALDRFQVKDKLEKGLSAGNWYIADRYTQSNFGHQGAKLAGAERKKLIAWIEALESRLPQPDLVIYLHVPVSVSQQLMSNREHKSYLDEETVKDMHELDPEYQQRVVETYLELAESRQDWVVISCVNPKSNELRSIDDIHQEVVDNVINKLDVYH
jgi:dTMP kinase